MTARRRSALRTIQRDAYLVQRASGDAEALRAGGLPRLAGRLARRRMTAQLFRWLR